MAGRKRFDIDWKKVGQLLEAGCSGAEVAASMGMDRNTLYKACKRDHKIDFSAYLQEKRSSGNTILRAAQFKTAIGGNVSMQIWLGKTDWIKRIKMKRVYPADLRTLLRM